MYTVVLNLSSLIPILFTLCVAVGIVSWFVKGGQKWWLLVMKVDLVVCGIVLLTTVLLESISNYFFPALGVTGASLIFYSTYSNSKNNNESKKTNNP